MAWGLGLQIVFALIVLKTTIGQRVFETLGAGINKLLGFAGVGAAFVFGPLGDSSVWGRAMTGALGPEGAQLRRHLRVPGAADDHLHRRAVRDPLLLRRHAARRAAVRRRDAPGDEASGAESLNVAASIFMGQTEAPLTIRPYLPEMTAVRADDGDDLRDGAHLGRHHGRLHPVRHRGQAPADRGDHDGARHDHDGQDAGARDRSAEDDGDGEAGGRADRRQRHRRRRPRHRRRAAPGAERRRDADLVPRAGRAGQRHPRLRAPEPAADLRLGVRAGRLEHGRAVARRAGRSATCSARAWR